MLDLMAIGILVWKLHAALHAFCYELYSAARCDIDVVMDWTRPLFWDIMDFCEVLVALGQLVL